MFARYFRRMGKEQMESSKALARIVRDEVLVSLGFEEIAQHLCTLFITEDSKQYFRDHRPLFDIKQVVHLHNQIKELSLRTQIQKVPQWNTLVSITEILNIGKKRTLHIEEISKIRVVLDAITRYSTWLKDTCIMEGAVSDFEESLLYVDKSAIIETLNHALAHYLDVQGNLIRTSIPQLVEIDKKKLNLHKKRYEIAKNFIDKHADICNAKIPTIRGERVVVPINVSYKNQVDGIIHGMSSSSQTVYIEIKALYEHNNELESLVLEEVKIVLEICQKLTQSILDQEHVVISAYHNFVEFDVLLAQYLYSLRYSGIFPEFYDKHTHPMAIHLPNSIHPLIEQCVPVTISLAPNVQQLILTGPNAGGKTIALKTLGLLSLMNQSGIPIPVAEGACLPVFERVEIVVGDNQNLAQGESTFSSHIRAVQRTLPRISEAKIDTCSQNPVLLLFDELCDGTDEQEGSTLAWAILENILEYTHCFTVVTTHSTLLKQYALIQDHVQIAALEHTQHARYTILYGSTGASEAPLLAKQIGMNEQILLRQKQLIEEYGNDTHALMNKLHSLTKKAKQKEQKAFKIFARAVEKQKELSKRYHYLKDKEFRLKKQTHDTSIGLLQKMRSSIERIVQKEKELDSYRASFQMLEPKTSYSQKKINQTSTGQIQEETTSKTLREDIEVFTKQIESNNDKVVHAEEQRRKQLLPLEVGDEVMVLETGIKGTVLSVLEDSKYLIRVGIVSITVRRDAIRVLEDTVYQEETLDKKFIVKEQETTQEVHYVMDRTTFPHAISAMKVDVRGCSVQEAFDRIYNHLDAIIISRLSSFSIIHGKGHGILARAIHAMLKEHILVQRYQYANPEDGGVGKTYVYLED